MRFMKKRVEQIILISCIVVGLAGCGRTPEVKETDKIIELSASDGTEQDTPAGSSAELDSVTGQGFQPPEGSHRDSRGNIVDPQGNTFDDDGGWQVPEGGRVDSKGRIYDKNGKLMGGGAPVGSKG